MNGPHYLLSVLANSPLSEIWVGDEEGNFVCKSTGWIQERLEPGTYVVQVGSLKAPKHFIILEGDLRINENELKGKRGKAMTRRRLIRQASEILAKTWIIMVLGIIVVLATQHVRADEAICTDAITPVQSVAENIPVSDELSTILDALGLPVNTFGSIACPVTTDTSLVGFSLTSSVACISWTTAPGR